MQRYVGRFSGWPQLSRRLWHTLVLGAVAGLNLLWQAEIWPHTPRAGAFWAWMLWGTTVLALPQLWQCGWHWLRGYEGPALVRVALTAGYLGGSLLGLLLWLALLVGGGIIGLGWQ
jgi:hypothetical protein